MKRPIAVGITIIFLLQALVGMRFVYEKKEERENAISEISTGCRDYNELSGNRGAEIENDSSGASWFDGFGNNSGISFSDNISIANGSAVLSGSYEMNGSLTSIVINRFNSWNWDILSVSENRK